MRYRKEHKQATRQRIIETAGRRFKKDGIDGSGNLFVSTWTDHRIREISGGYVSTVAGSGSPGSSDGTGIAATFNNPSTVRFDSFGHLYASDYANNRIRAITYASGTGSVTWTAPAANGGQSPTSYTVAMWG